LSGTGFAVRVTSPPIAHRGAGITAPTMTRGGSWAWGVPNRRRSAATIRPRRRPRSTRCTGRSRS